MNVNSLIIISFIVTIIAKNWDLSIIVSVLRINSIIEPNLIQIYSFENDAKQTRIMIYQTF